MLPPPPPPPTLLPTTHPTVPRCSGERAPGVAVWEGREFALRERRLPVRIGEPACRVGAEVCAPPLS